MGELTFKVVIPKGIAKLVPAFLENRQMDLQYAADAAESAHWDTLALTGHRLYGTAGSYGFVGLAEVGQDLEQAATKHDRERVADCLRRWQVYLAQVEVVYDDGST